MEGAAPAAPLPARGRHFSHGLGTAAWALLAVAAAAGAGLLAATHERLFVDLVLVAVAATGIRLFPFPALLLVLLVAPKHSPFAELLFTCGAGLIVVWRLARAPGRAFLFPLAAFLLFTLPLVEWHSGLRPGGTGAVLTIPGAHYSYLTTPSVEGFEWLRIAFVLIVSLLAALEVRSVRRLHVVAGVALAAAVYPIATGVKQLAAGDLVAKGDFSAVRGSFSFPNEFAVYLVLFLLLATVAVFELRSRFLRLAVAVLAGVGLLMLLHSYTRSAWIGFAVGLALLAVIRYRGLIAVALLVLVIAVVGFPSEVNSVQARFGDLAAQNAANSKNSLKWRRGQWKAMWHFGSEKPLTGQGFGSYRRLTIKEFGLEGRTYGTVQDADGSGHLSFGFTAHNDFVKSWVETGVLGLILWLGTLAGLGYTLIRALRVPGAGAWAAGLLSALLAFLVMSLSDNVQAYTVPLVYLCGLTGAVAGVANAARISSARRASS
jgi:O-antigen ligase